MYFNKLFKSSPNDSIYSVESENVNNIIMYFQTIINNSLIDGFVESEIKQAEIISIIKILTLR